MKNPANNASSSQKVLTGVKNAISRPIRAARLKNNVDSTKGITKRITRALFTSENDKENLSLEKKESAILPNSKKIRKSSQKPIQTSASRKPLVDITNTRDEKSLDRKSSKKIQPEKTFLEDEAKQTKNYITLNYVNSRTKQDYSFYCFHDRDLDIPIDYAAKTITHSCDNDCTTDEDQIRGAIKNVFRSLENRIKELKEAENKACEDLIRSF